MQCFMGQPNQFLTAKFIGKCLQTRSSIGLVKVGVLMAQKVRDLVFVSAGTPGLDLTWSPSEGVMMMNACFHT